MEENKGEEGEGNDDIDDTLESGRGGGSSLVLNSQQGGNCESLLKCLFCDNHTNVATSRETYLDHLKNTHRFIIANDHLIADFKR